MSDRLRVPTPEGGTMFMRYAGPAGWFIEAIEQGHSTEDLLEQSIEETLDEIAWGLAQIEAELKRITPADLQLEQQRMQAPVSAPPAHVVAYEPSGHLLQALADAQACSLETALERARKDPEAQLAALELLAGPWAGESTRTAAADMIRWIGKGAGMQRP